MDLRVVGIIRSSLTALDEAPRQGREGAPDAWLDIEPCRDVLVVHPRSDPRLPLTGVFATRSPDRLNPLGLHPVVVRAIGGTRLRIGPIEAIDGTPVVDVKSALG